MDLRQKINDRLDQLQAMLEANEHLTDPDTAIGLTYRLSPFWSILSEEDRDYIQCAQHAIEEKMPWGDPHK